MPGSASDSYQGPPDDGPDGLTHFVGFRDDRYLTAVRVFGRPDFIHPTWDLRARREIAEGDRIVFATGDEHQPAARFNAPDFIEQEPT